MLNGPGGLLSPLESRPFSKSRSLVAFESGPPDARKMHSFESDLDFDSRPVLQGLYESEYARMGVIAGTNVVLFQQTAQPIPKTELEAIWHGIDASLASVVRSAHALLLDVRKARGRNDPEFEQLFAPHRTRLVLGWRRVAIVVMTAPGLLQVQRYAREDNLDVRIFEDPNAAFAWLRRAY